MITLENVRCKADVYGISLEYIDLPENMFGIAVWHPGHSPQIVLDVSLLDDPIKHKCTMAHEIGHIITAYGNGMPRLSATHIMRSQASRVEYQGKKWAAKFLVPYRELKAVMRSGNCEVWELQEYFGVTRDAIWFRLNMSDGLRLKNEIARKLNGQIVQHM